MRLWPGLKSPSPSLSYFFWVPQKGGLEEVRGQRWVFKKGTTSAMEILKKGGSVVPFFLFAIKMEFDKIKLMMQAYLKKFFLSIFLILAVLFLGTSGYMIIEGWRFLDAFYMTVITLTTVGYREVGALTDAGRIFTIFLIFSGIGVVLYTLQSIFEYIIGGNLGDAFKEKQIEKKISTLKNHFIVCGCGRVGRQVCEEFESEGIPFVVTDQNQEKIKFAQKKGWLYLVGDATSEDFLEKAGVRRARGLLTVVDEDQDNVFITLTARSMNPNLFIISRASNDENVTKLYKAGADRVAVPYKIGGFHMAAMAMRPAVVDFLDTVISAKNRDLLIEDIKVNSDFYNGKSIGETLPLKTLGIAILAVNRKNGESIVSPDSDFVLEVGDRLIAMGESKKIEELKKRLEGKKIKIIF